MEKIFNKFGAFKKLKDSLVGKGMQWFSNPVFRYEFHNMKLSIHPIGLNYIGDTTLSWNGIKVLMEETM